ncbi:hypothetical protein AMELA_G00061530 [Ameiurus melas]|uniref:Uncharacterized protein n=1 Tax=Ameiurus melas TaxID=219545 RepID=A0A7J6B3H5_AMEME|nr:hypothetical protein AMELA_G00061530 [Ameiurus melas]
MDLQQQHLLPAEIGPHSKNRLSARSGSVFCRQTSDELARTFWGYKTTLFTSLYTSKAHIARFSCRFLNNNASRFLYSSHSPVTLTAAPAEA